jgi:hypothetical protein
MTSPISSRPNPRSPIELADQVARLEISPDLIRSVITELTAIGSSPLGFRTTGTPEDLATAEAVASRFRAAGLEQVAIENVRVDSWRFRSASVRTADGGVIPASSFGGVPGTPAQGSTGRFVDLRDPLRRKLDRLDLTGAVVLVDWTSKAVPACVPALELARRGVVAMILGPGGAWFGSDGALGAFDAQWVAGCPPMVVIPAREADRLRADLPDTVTVALEVETARRVDGQNVVGYLRGDDPNPIVVGAHHDAWFRGAFDNTSGVATTIALAAALVESGCRPRHTICFTSRTGEEFGQFNSQFDWCIGAWRQISEAHPDWAQKSPFHLCLEASGHPNLRTIIEAPAELRSWSKAMARIAAARGWLPTGWRVAPPVAGTEQWPYLVAGVPGVAAYAWGASFADTEYHTQLDVLDQTVDCDLVAAQTRLYALLLLAADADPEGILDHGARAREMQRMASRAGSAALARAAASHGARHGRAAFAPVGRQLHALDAKFAARYPHEQAMKDVTALDAALTALHDGDRGRALRQLRRVGCNALYRYLSFESMQQYRAQFTDEAVHDSWGSASHLTPSPDLWTAISTLDGSAVEPLSDSGLHTALRAARAEAAAELDRRVTAMAAALSGGASAPGPDGAENRRTAVPEHFERGG